MSQELVDQTHQHLTKLQDMIAPLTKPGATMSDVMKTVADIGADPDIKFNHMEGASLLASLPENMSSEQINQLAGQQLRQLQQAGNAFTQQFPSSQHLAAQQPQLATS